MGKCIVKKRRKGNKKFGLIPGASERVCVCVCWEMKQMIHISDLGDAEILVHDNSI